MITLLILKMFAYLLSYSYLDYALLSEFEGIKEEHLNTKSIHMKKLRPNLSNPQCRPELRSLVDTEKTRIETYFGISKSSRANLLDIQFARSNGFFKSLLNHFEFLLTYYDSMILFEDFKKLPGDDDI